MAGGSSPTDTGNLAESQDPESAQLGSCGSSADATVTLSQEGKPAGAATTTEQAELDPAGVASALSEALTEWLRSPDRAALAGRLLRLIEHVSPSDLEAFLAARKRHEP